MKFKGITALILVVALLLGSATSYADKLFSGYERNTAFGGMSKILADFYEENEDATAKIQAILKPLIELEEQKQNNGTADPIEYPSRLLGIVCVPGNLNIRKSESAVSEIVARAWQKSEVYVYGEHLVKGNLWYKVHYEDTDGYVIADYVKFGSEADQYFVDLHEEEKANAVMPASFDIWDDISGLDAGVQDKLSNYKKQINYSLKYDYPKAKQESQYLNMYSIMVYLLENYQHILDLSIDNGLTKTHGQAAQDVRTINLLRENLTDTTGTTSEEFQKQLQEAIAKRQQQTTLSKGEQMANFAASFVGKLPYVWGGASLTSGADCSGFLGQVYAHFGLIDQAAANRHALDSTSMRRLGAAVDIRNIQPGDLVCYNGHVSIYYGGGTVVHAPNPGRKVEFGNLYMMPIITIRRLQ